MLQKFYSIILHKNKEKSLLIDLRNQVLQEHWRDVSIGRKKSFLPLPVEAEFGITIKEITGLKEELNGIHKRLSILEDKTLCKSYPLNNELHQP